MTDFSAATDLIAQHLARTVGYPTETKAFAGLVNGLINAEKLTGVAAARIVERCAGLSKYCPTDYDLQQVAKDMARCDAVAAGTFDSMAGASNVAVPVEALREQYGEPAPFDWTKIDRAHVKRVRDRERELIQKIKAKYPGELGWAGMAAAAEELGYLDYAKLWFESLVGNENHWKRKVVA